jgi:hypothetical protein
VGPRESEDVAPVVGLNHRGATTFWERRVLPLSLSIMSWPAYLARRPKAPPTNLPRPRRGARRLYEKLRQVQARDETPVSYRATATRLWYKLLVWLLRLAGWLDRIG